MANGIPGSQFNPQIPPDSHAPRGESADVPLEIPPTANLNQQVHDPRIANAALHLKFPHLPKNEAVDAQIAKFTALIMGWSKDGNK